jgi:hypothetical protein
MSEPPPPLEIAAPALPPALYAAVSRCLEKQPAARYQSVAELAYALAPLGSARARQSVERISRVLGIDGASMASTGQHSVPAVTADARHSVGTQANWGDTQPKPSATRRSALPFVGLALVALLAGGAWLALRSQASGSNVEPAASTAGPPSATTAPVAPEVSAAPAPAAVVSSAPVAAPPSEPLPPSTASAAPAPAAAAAPGARRAPVTHRGAAPASATPAKAATPPAASPPAPAAPAPAAATTPPSTARSRL